MVEIFTLSRVTVGLLIMCVAAISDWRTRRVSNKAWIIMGVAGMAILAVDIFQAENGNINHFLIFIPICILFFDVFWDREPIFGNGIDPIPIVLYLIALLGVLSLLYLEGLTREVVQLLTVPGMIVVAELFYYTGLLHGGADAKALMALAILFPVYPDISGLPIIGFPANQLIVDNLQIIFPFAFLLLMNAAILQVVSVPLGLFFRNLVKRDFGFPEMFLGYRMDIHMVRKKFVWPMEVVRDGEIRLWVTPKIPFIIPMLLGLIFSLVIGNLIMLMF